MEKFACSPRRLPLRAQGWEDAVKNWQEIPKGGLYKGDVKKIWYNHAVSGQAEPLWRAPARRKKICAGWPSKPAE